MDKHDIHTMLVRRDEAYALLASIEDPIEKKIMEDALFQLAWPFLRFEGLSEEQFDEGLPTVPFDSLFYLQALRRLFVDQHRIANLLAGDLDALVDMPG